VVLAVLIDALEAVGAEIVALRLDEVRGAARLTERVEVAECRRQCRDRQAIDGRMGHNAAKRRMCLLHHLDEVADQEQVSGSASNDFASVPRNCERMMHPARQMRAIVGIGRFHWNSSEA